MKVELTHKLEFDSPRQPTISELRWMISVALDNGFPEDMGVYIRAGTDDRDHDYTFHATFSREKGETDER